MAPGAAFTQKSLRKFLRELSDQLTISDVGSMKFVCRDKLGAGLLERVSNEKPFELFELLQQKQLISLTDLSWLREIFVRIQRFDLVAKVPACQQQDAVDSGAMVGGQISPVSPGISAYRALLKELADELTSSQVDEIKFLLNIPAGKSHKIVNGESLLLYMEECQELSENNLTELKDVLSEIHRKDLAKKVNHFSRNRGQEAGFPQQVFSPTSNLMRPEDFLSTPGNRAPEEPPPFYPMTSPRGFALIINIEEFDGETADGKVLNARRGTHVDVEYLRDLWAKLDFIVESHSNLTAEQIVTVTQNMAAKIREDSSCFVCCIMTHGKLGSIFGADSKLVGIGTITGYFKENACPNLAGKPKLFFIQACRGQSKLTSTSSWSNVGTPESNTDAYPSGAVTTEEDDESYALRHHADPAEPHFLLGYATAPGFVSFRSTAYGSWYMGALVKNFSKHREKEDVISMMVRVNATVSSAYSPENYKQCPAPVVTLTKKVWFRSFQT